MNILQNFIISALILTGTATTFGQGGYKQFKWGESIKSVNAKDSLLDTTQHTNYMFSWGIGYAYYHETGYDGFIDTRYFFSDVRRIIEEKMDSIVSIRYKDYDAFIFADNKLFAVKILNIGLLPRMCAEVLDKKYYNVGWKFHRDSMGFHRIKTWFVDPELIVVLKGGDASCILYYIDKRIYDLISREFDEVRAEVAEKKQKKEQELFDKTQKSLEKIEP